MRILFQLDQPGLLIHFDKTVEMLARRGHEVHLMFGKQKFAEAAEVLDRENPRVKVVETPARERQDAYAGIAGRVRAAADNIHYLHPGLRGARYSRAKWRELWDPALPLRLLSERETLSARTVHGLLKLLALLEEAIPSDPAIERAIEKVDPDVVLVSPLIINRSYQTDYLKSAERLGVRTGVPVTSWDNLTSKGLLRHVPDRVMVWNETQRREVTEHHFIPDDRVVITGAQPFDRWFDRGPSTSREAFCARFGLPHDKAYVLFVGSTRQNLPDGTDVPYVKAWIEGLRASADPIVRELSILIRPHPGNYAGWLEVEFEGLGDVAIWNRENLLPILEHDRAEYFDSIYHCSAVVGINSSAMLEAAIVGRPAYSILAPEWDIIQRGVIHYHYLLPENGGYLREARTVEEHADLLSADLRDPVPSRTQQRAFVRSFVRPQGIDVPSTPELVAAIEELGAMPARPTPARPELYPLRALLAAGILGSRLTAEGHQQVAQAAPRTGKALRRGSRRIRPDDPGWPRRIPAPLGARLAAAMVTLGEASADLGRRSERQLKRRGVRVRKHAKPAEATTNGKVSKGVKPPKAAKPPKPPKAAKPPKPAKPPKAAKPPKPPTAAKPPKPADPSPTAGLPE